MIHAPTSSRTAPASLTCLAGLLLLAQAAQAANFSSVQSGAWDDTATWGAASFSGSGDTDTATIQTKE